MLQPCKTIWSIISTNYFNKQWNNSQMPSSIGRTNLPENDQGATELCHHHQPQSVSFRESGGNCDYATASGLGRAQQQRRHGRVVRLHLDVTLLEYIVSMHAKRGEFSRSASSGHHHQVEINIKTTRDLEEARATRRSFMRYLCSVFLWRIYTFSRIWHNFGHRILRIVFRHILLDRMSKCFL